MRVVSFFYFKAEFKQINNYLLKVYKPSTIMKNKEFSPESGLV